MDESDYFGPSGGDESFIDQVALFVTRYPRITLGVLVILLLMVLWAYVKPLLTKSTLQSYQKRSVVYR